MGPLEGVRVLDLSRILTGPYCSMMLADLGAEVIKVEAPGSGDDTRQWGPPFINGESAYFLSINRNKKSITLNLKSSRGREILFELARRSDVVLENFRPGTAEKLGIGYDVLKEVNPGIIYCAISGYGQTGPYRDKPGYDVIIQGMGGLMGVTGEEGGPPVKVGVAIADIGGGMWAAYAILSALYYREKTGRGQYIDTSLLEGLVAWLSFMAGVYFATGKNPRKLGSGHPTIVPYQAFRGKDGKYFTVGAGNDGFWQKLCKVMGIDLDKDPRFATNPKRVENREVLIPLLQSEFDKKTSKEWLELLDAAGIPCGPISGLDEVFADSQVLARNMLVQLEHPRAGEIKLTGIPVKFSETPGEIKSPPPLLGEHTEEILSELGYSPGDIARLRQEGAI